jgi:hypothetical protein
MTRRSPEFQEVWQFDDPEAQLSQTKRTAKVQLVESEFLPQMVDRYERLEQFRSLKLVLEFIQMIERPFS